MPVVRFLRGLRPFSFFFFFLGAVFFFFAIVISSFPKAPDPLRGTRISNWYPKKADGLSPPLPIPLWYAFTSSNSDFSRLKINSRNGLSLPFPSANRRFGPREPLFHN